MMKPIYQGRFHSRLRRGGGGVGGGLRKFVGCLSSTSTNAKVKLIPRAVSTHYTVTAYHLRPLCSRLDDCAFGCRTCCCANTRVEHRPSQRLEPPTVRHWPQACIATPDEHITNTRDEIEGSGRTLATSPVHHHIQRAAVALISDKPERTRHHRARGRVDQVHNTAASAYCCNTRAK